VEVTGGLSGKPSGLCARFFERRGEGTRSQLRGSLEVGAVAEAPGTDTPDV